MRERERQRYGDRDTEIEREGGDLEKKKEGLKKYL